MTCLVNYDQNFARNLVMWAYIISNMLVMYSYDLRKSPGTVKRELLRFNHTFMIASFIGQAISLITFFLGIAFAYTIDGVVYYYGIYEGRIWGVLLKPQRRQLLHGHQPDADGGERHHPAGEPLPGP